MTDRPAPRAATPVPVADLAGSGGTAAIPVREYPDDRTLIGQVLRPYRSHCQYLKSAVTRISAGLTDESATVGVVCDFEIPESCYIDDTGHFNSVEFNICYNQMLYFTVAKMVKESLVDPFTGWSMADFWAHQLPDILITDFRSSFRSPMSGGRFSGFLNITEIIEWEKNDLRDALVVLQTDCGYSDDRRGECQGDVTVAITNPPVRPSDVRSGREPSAARTPEPTAARPLLASLPTARRRDELFDLVSAELKTALLMGPSDELAPDANYFELGVTSLQVVEIKQHLERRLICDIESALLFNNPTLDSFVAALATGGPADLAAAPQRVDGPSPAASTRQTLVEQLLKDLYPAE